MRGVDGHIYANYLQDVTDPNEQFLSKHFAFHSRKIYFQGSWTKGKTLYQRIHEPCLLWKARFFIKVLHKSFHFDIKKLWCISKFGSFSFGILGLLYSFCFAPFLSSSPDPASSICLHPRISCSDTAVVPNSIFLIAWRELLFSTSTAGMFILHLSFADN